MGKPMKSRILGIVLALSLLGTVFAAFPVNAAVNYTGSVVTTDNLGAPKSTYFYGEPVYVNVELNYQGDPYNGYVTVYLERATDEWRPTHFHAWTNNPDVGWNNGSVSGSSLSTWYSFTGEIMAYDIVVTYGGSEIARTPITVRNVGLSLSPDSSMYYPGEEVTITFVTTHTTDVFYVQIVNETGATAENWTGQTALTGIWTTVWTVRADHPDGHYWLNVNDAGTHATWASADFDVQKYEMLVDSDRDGYLPGETAKIAYLVRDVATMGPYSGVTIEVSAHYLNDSGNDSWQNETLTSSSGTYDFLIPTDIALYSNVDITYWANESTTRSYEAWLTLNVGLLTADLDVYWGAYMPGDTVNVYVSAWAAGDELPGASVDIAVEKNGTTIDTYGRTGILTDLGGDAVHSFQLDASAAEGSYIVNVTVTKVGFTVSRSSTFMVMWGGELMMDTDKAYYYSGDDVVMTFRTIWNKADVLDQPVAYTVWADFGVMLTGNTTDTTAAFAIPADYYGGLYIEATANFNGFMLGDDVNVVVYFANIILTPREDTFKQGDTIVFDFQILTSFTEGDLAWEIFDNDGVRVAQDTIDFTTSGSFDYDVPESNPSSYYEAGLTMTTETGAFRQAWAEVNIVQDYQLQVWAGKSSYATGEFKPGQKVTVHYVINVYTHEQLPMYLLEIGNWYDSKITYVQVTDSEGSFTVEIPKDSPNGEFGIWVNLWDPVTDTQLWGDSTKVVVSSQLSAWDKSVGGMAASDFVILVLIVLMLLLLIIVPFLKGRMGGTKATTTPPPAEPPKV